MRHCYYYKEHLLILHGYTVCATCYCWFILDSAPPWMSPLCNRHWSFTGQVRIGLSVEKSGMIERVQLSQRIVCWAFVFVFVHVWRSGACLEKWCLVKYSAAHFLFHSWIDLQCCCRRAAWKTGQRHEEEKCCLVLSGSSLTTTTQPSTGMSACL